MRYSDPIKGKGLTINIVVADMDAIAVKAVGATIVCSNPEKIPLIQEAMKRSLGEGTVNQIEVLGCSMENI